MTKPLKSFAAGGVRAALWENEIQVDGSAKTMLKATIERRYKDRLFTVSCGYLRHVVSKNLGDQSPRPPGICRLEGKGSDQNDRGDDRFRRIVPCCPAAAEALGSVPTGALSSSAAQGL